MDKSRSRRGAPTSSADSPQLPKITVFVVDDHDVVRRGVADLLNEAADLTVIGEAATVLQALARIPAACPDVAVLDVSLPDGNGIELCRKLRSKMPELHCLMLTSYANEKAMLDAFLSGAEGFVIKDITGIDLVAAVRTVGSGSSLLDKNVAEALFSRLRAGGAVESGPLSGLTQRERTTLDLIGEGLTNRQIAARMFVAEKTIKNYVSALLAKLGMTNRTQAAVMTTEVHDLERAHATRSPYLHPQ